VEEVAVRAVVQVDLAKDTIACCRIGERSVLTWSVLHELLGAENVKNCDGSWTEYDSLLGVPIELGVSPASSPCRSPGVG
jgi:thiosulfate/3-mercaptopyruvate sulfurtransferase